jgi:hypothetical protein
MNLRHIHLEKKNQHDLYTRKSREKDRDVRNLKKAELQMKVAEESLCHTKAVYEKLKAQVTSLGKHITSKQSKSKQIRAKQIKAKQITSNHIKSNQIKSNRRNRFF